MLLSGTPAEARRAYTAATEALRGKPADDDVWLAAALEGVAASALLEADHVRERRSSDLDAAGADGGAAGAACLGCDDALREARARMDEAMRAYAEAARTRGARALELQVGAAFRLARLFVAAAAAERARVDAEDAAALDGDPSAALLLPEPGRWRHGLTAAQIVVAQFAYEPAMRCAAAAAARPATTVTRTDSDGGGAAEAAAQLCLHTCLAAAAFSAELGHRRKASYYAREAARVRREALSVGAAHPLLLRALSHELHALPPLLRRLTAPPGAGAAAPPLPMLAAAAGGWGSLRLHGALELLECAEAVGEARAHRAVCNVYAACACTPMAARASADAHWRRSALCAPPRRSCHRRSRCRRSACRGWSRCASRPPPAELVPIRRSGGGGGAGGRPVFLRRYVSAADKALAAARAAAGQTDDGGAVPWVCGVRAAATAVLHNPLHEPLELQLVEIVTDGGAAFSAEGRQLLLPARSTAEVELGGMPSGAAAGEVRLRGVRCRFHNVDCVHPVRCQGPLRGGRRGGRSHRDRRRRRRRRRARHTRLALAHRPP